MIKKEYRRCGPHPPQVISPRARPPLVKGAGCIGPLPPDPRGRPPRLMAPIELWGPQNPAPEAAPGAPFHPEALSPKCGREHQETGDRGPTRHAGTRLWGPLGPTAHGLLWRRHPGPRLQPQPHSRARPGFEVSRLSHPWRGGWHVPILPGVWSLGAL